MKVTINFWDKDKTHISNYVGISFFKYLSSEYIKLNANNSALQCRTSMFYFGQYDQTTTRYVVKKFKILNSINVPICSANARDWLPFKRWCLSNGVNIIVGEKKADAEGVYWASVVTLTVDDNNETLFMFKMKQE